MIELLDKVVYAQYRDIIDIIAINNANLLQNNPSVVFLSRIGQSHQRVDLDGLTWNHGTTVLDANQDGWLDVINSNGEMWINTQAGGFTYRAKDTFLTIVHPLAGAGGRRGGRTRRRRSSGGDG